MLLHGDLNPTNVLSAEREPWLAIDPKPMVGDPPTTGPGSSSSRTRSSPPTLVARIDHRLDIVSETMGVDRDALLLWCLVGAVEMGAGAREPRRPPEGRRSRARHVELIAARLP